MNPLTREPTDAQENALARLKKRHGHGIQVDGYDAQHRVVVVLPGDEPLRRRRRFITQSGIVERGL